MQSFVVLYLHSVTRDLYLCYSKLSSAFVVVVVVNFHYKTILHINFKNSAWNTILNQKHKEKSLGVQERNLIISEVTEFNICEFSIHGVFQERNPREYSGVVARQTEPVLVMTVQ